MPPTASHLHSQSSLLAQFVLAAAIPARLAIAATLLHHRNLERHAGAAQAIRNRLGRAFRGHPSKGAGRHVTMDCLARRRERVTKPRRSAEPWSRSRTSRGAAVFISPARKCWDSENERQSRLQPTTQVRNSLTHGLFAGNSAVFGIIAHNPWISISSRLFSKLPSLAVSRVPDKKFSVRNPP